MTEAIFDTSVLVDHLRGVEHARKLIEKVKNGVIIGYISILTEAELLSGKDADDKTKREYLMELLNYFNKIDVNENIARLAGDFRRKYGIALIDCIIASTAENLHCKLITKDIKDFKPIKEILVEEPY